MMAIACTIRLDLPLHGNALSEIMGQIRFWLDHEHIKPLSFKSNEAHIGLSVDVTFANEVDAERFRRHFLGP